MSGEMKRELLYLILQWKQIVCMHHSSCKGEREGRGARKEEKQK